MKRFRVLAVLLLPFLLGAMKPMGLTGKAATAVSAGSIPTVSIPTYKSHSTGTGQAITGIAPTAGHLLVAWIFVFGGGNVYTTHSITDNSGGTWTLVGGATNGSSSACRVSMWFQKNCAAGITTITPASGAGGSGTICIVKEVTGASTTTPFTTGEFSVGNITSTTANPVTGTVTYATANSIVMAGGVFSLTGTPTMTVNQAGSTGGTWGQDGDTTNSQETDASNYGAASTATVGIAATGTAAHGWTISTASFASYAVAAFHP